MDGKFLLPAKMRGTTVGEFFTLKVQLSPQKARVATVALGMSSKEVLDLYRPETDRAEKDHAIVFDSTDDDGRYLLIFSSRDDGGTPDPKLDALSKVIYQPGARVESTYLLPCSKRGALVPTMYKRILEEARAQWEKGRLMNQNESDVHSSGPHRGTVRDRAMMYGFVVSIIGVAIGVVFGLPIIWGLAIFGIVTGGIKIVLRRFNPVEQDSAALLPRSNRSTVRHCWAGRCKTCRRRVSDLR